MSSFRGKSAAPGNTTNVFGAFLSPVSNEPSADSDLPVKGSDSSSSGENVPFPAAERTAAREPESDLVEYGNGEELGRTRAQTRVLNREASALVAMLGPDEGGTHIHGLLAVQEITRKPGEVP